MKIKEKKKEKKIEITETGSKLRFFAISDSKIFCKHLLGREPHLLSSLSQKCP